MDDIQKPHSVANLLSFTSVKPWNLTREKIKDAVFQSWEQPSEMRNEVLNPAVAKDSITERVVPIFVFLWFRGFYYLSHLGVFITHTSLNLL